MAARTGRGQAGLIIGCAALLGCFSPSVPADVRCGPDGACPDGRRCEAAVGLCVAASLPEVAGLRFAGLPAPVEARRPLPVLEVELVDARGGVVAVTGGSFELRLTDAPAGVGLIGTVRSAAASGVIRFAGVQVSGPGRGVRLAVEGGTHAGTSEPFDVLTARPVVSALAPPATVEGCVAVPYALAQDESLAVDLLVEVDPDGARGPAGFRRATQGPSAPGQAGVQGAPSSPAGRPQAFTWNTSVDLPGVDAEAILRFTPRLGDRAGEPVLSAPVQVSNGTRFVRSQFGEGRFLTLADLDGDDADDLVYSHEGNLRVQYARHPQPHVTLELQADPQDAAAGDFDGDGLSDLAWIRADGSVRVARGKAFLGGLGPATPVDLPAARQLLAADLDRDGRDELVVVEAASGRVVVLDAGFVESARPWPGSRDTGRVALGDLDDDGWLDLVVARTGAPVALVTQAHGTFGAPQDLAGLSGATVALADLDHDGRLDLATIDDLGVHIRPGRPAGEIVTLAGAGGAALALGDVDGDGRTDVVSSRTGGIFLHAHVADRSALAFAPPRRIDFVGASHLLVTDDNRDGRADVLAESGTGASNVYYNRTPRRCGGGLAGPRGRASQGSEVHLADLDGDGKLDVLAFHRGGRARVSSGLGNGELASPVDLEVDVEGELRSVEDLASADLDHDGALDLVVLAGYPREEMRVLLQHRDAAGTFETLTAPVDGKPVALALDDLDRDGTLDLVTMGTSLISVHRGDPLEPGRFLPSTPLPGVVTAVACNVRDRCDVWVRDLDGDGWPEVVAETEQHVAVYRPAPGQPGVYLEPVTTELPSVHILAIDDLLGDGQPRLLLDRGPDLRRLELHELGPDGTLVLRWFASTGSEPGFASAAVADLDADGVPELAVNNILGATHLFSLPEIASGGVVPDDRLLFVSGGPELVHSGPSVRPGRLSFADMDGDGRQDLVACGYYGCFVAPARSGPKAFDGGALVVGAAGGALTGVSLGDLDGDGLLDVAGLSAAGVSLALQRAAQPGRFEPRPGALPGAGVVRLADASGDGVADVITTPVGGHLIQVSQPDGSFAAVCPLDEAWSAVAVGDLNRDGVADVVGAGAGVQLHASGPELCTSSSTVMGLPPLQSDEVERYWPRVPLLAVRDLDHDGRQDVIAVVHDVDLVTSAVQVALQASDRAGGFEPVVEYAIDGLVEGALGDVDRDGWLDLVVAIDFIETDIMVMRGNPGAPGTFLAPEPIVAGVVAEALTLGDVDDDGDLDVLALGDGGSRVYLQTSRLPLTFEYAYHTLSPPDGDWGSPHMVDLDADGHLDYVSMSSAHGVVMVSGR